MSKLDITITHPSIAAEWHPTKNEGLTPQDITHSMRKKVWWLCTCGYEWYTYISNRTQPSIKSGCPRCNWKGYKTYFNRLKQGAKVRNIPFQITIEDAWNKFTQQNGKCALTDLPLLLSHNTTKNTPTYTEHTASLDRIDNTKGYTLDNIQWVHKQINEMKMDQSQIEFIRFCKLVADRN